MNCVSMNIKINKLHEHPEADIVPLMRKREYAELRESMQKHGFLESKPLEISRDYAILDGRHRYRIAKELGITEVPYIYADLRGYAELEYIAYAAIQRRQLTDDQRAAMILDLKRRMNEDAARNRRNSPHPNLNDLNNLETSSEIFKPRDTRHERAEIAKVTDWKMRQVDEIDRMAKQQRGYAEAMKLLGDIRNGSTTINQAHRVLKQQKQRAQIKDLKPVQGKYNLIVIDPPWEFKSEYDPQGWRGPGDYPTMTLQQIKDIKLPAADNCILWLWVVEAHHRQVWEVLEAWGFEHKDTLIWKKDSMRLGVWLRHQHEYCFLAVKGKPVFLGGKETTILEAPVKMHSEKPDAFYEMAKRLSPYEPQQCLDYFARKKREGWTVFGDEVEA